MSDDEIEKIVQQNCYLIMEYLVEVATKQFRAPIEEFELKASQTTQRFGASGQLLISTIYFDTEHGSGTTSIAIKYFNQEQNAMDELRNSLELDVRFKTHPHFATPKVIFASTKDPLMLIYEGVNAVNYDEIEHPDKVDHTGRLLAAMHQGDYRPVNTETYQGLARIIGTYLQATGLEKEISDGLGREFKKLEGALSGCNPFADFHQSNVMLAINNDEITKTYIIDPEFMMKGSFDRLEDVGTFFGQQLLNEFKATGSIVEGVRDVEEFLKSYQKLNLDNRGLSWNKMYPNGNPLGFFISQWAIMDAIDNSQRKEIEINDPELMPQINYIRYVLDSANFRFPE